VRGADGPYERGLRGALRHGAAWCLAFRWPVAGVHRFANGLPTLIVARYRHGRVVGGRRVLRTHKAGGPSPIPGCLPAPSVVSLSLTRHSRPDTGWQVAGHAVRATVDGAQGVPPCSRFKKRDSQHLQAQHQRLLAPGKPGRAVRRRPWCWGFVLVGVAASRSDPSTCHRTCVSGQRAQVVGKCRREVGLRLHLSMSSRQPTACGRRTARTTTRATFHALSGLPDTGCQGYSAADYEQRRAARANLRNSACGGIIRRFRVAASATTRRRAFPRGVPNRDWIRLTGP